MNQFRKAKVAKTNEEKAKRKIEMPKATIDDKSIAMGQIEQLNTHHDNGRVIDAATVTAEQNTMPQLQAKAEVQNKTGLAGNNAMRNGTLPQLDNIQAKAEVHNPTGLAGNEEKPKSWSELLEERRDALKQEKTDAAKMQKYHALSDVLKAIGQMGGAAVGGAIGGNALDSAPAVGEYKESRGYLDALERTKQANDRLRALDEQGFQLALRDQDRSYEQQQRKLDRDFQMKLREYDAKIRAAEAAADFQRRAELQKQMAELQHQYDMEKAELEAKNEKEVRQMIIDGDIAKSKIGQETVRLQMAGKNSGAANTGVFSGKPKTIRFSNRSVISIPDDAYDVVKESILAMEQVNGVDVDKENIDSIIRNNPDLVNGILMDIGLIEKPESAPTTHSYNRYKDQSVKSPTGLVKNFNGPDPYDDDEYNIYARK